MFDESGTGKIKQIQFLHKLDDTFNIVAEKLRKIAEKLTGSNNLKLLNMQLFEKHSHISKPTRAHQDNAYFKVSPSTALTFWIALDDMDEDNGCLYYSPYTHLLPTFNHSRYHNSTTFRVRSGVPGLSLCLHEHPSETDIPMICSAGDMYVHNCNLTHRAGKNNTNRQRRAIGVVFIPESCKKDERLVKHSQNMLKEDIELQQIKNPLLYQKLRKEHSYLF